MSLNVFKLCSILSLSSAFFVWEYKSQAFLMEGNRKFAYFVDYEFGTIGVCIVIVDKFEKCRDLTKDNPDFKYTTNIAEYNNRLYVTDDYNNVVKVYRINKEDGGLEKLQEIDGFYKPNGIAFKDHRILIANYNMSYNGLSILDLNREGILSFAKKLEDLFVTTYNLYKYNFDFPLSSYTHSVKFYTKNSKTVAYFSDYASGIVQKEGYFFPSLSVNNLNLWDLAIIKCEVNNYFSITNGYFKNCYYASKFENDDKYFDHPEKIFINKDIFYTTNYNNKKFTYSKINDNFTIESPNVIKFNDNFRVNFADFYSGYAYLASAGYDIKKCKLQPDGDIAADCNMKVDFSGTPLAGKTFDIIKFVDVG